jgi:hypothetical protein
LGRHQLQKASAASATILNCWLHVLVAYYNVCNGRAFRTHASHIANLRQTVDSVSEDDLESYILQNFESMTVMAHSWPVTWTHRSQVVCIIQTFAKQKKYCPKRS